MGSSPYLDLDALEASERSGQRVPGSSFMRQSGGQSYLDLDALEKEEPSLPRRAWGKFKDVLAIPASAADWAAGHVPGIQAGEGAAGELLRKTSLLQPTGQAQWAAQKGLELIARNSPEAIKPIAEAVAAGTDEVQKQAYRAAADPLMWLLPESKLVAGAFLPVGIEGAVDATRQAYNTEGDLSDKTRAWVGAAAAAAPLGLAGVGLMRKRAAARAQAAAEAAGGEYLHDPNLTAERRAQIEAEANAPATPLLDARQATLAEGAPVVPLPENVLRTAHVELETPGRAAPGNGLRSLLFRSEVSRVEARAARAAAAIGQPDRLPTRQAGGEPGVSGQPDAGRSSAALPGGPREAGTAPTAPDLAALAARGAVERAATAALRAELQDKTGGAFKAPEDLAALAAIRATEAPPAKPRLALAREARLAEAAREDLVSTGSKVRLSPAAARAARLEGAAGLAPEAREVARLQKVVERANDPRGQTGTGIQRRAARLAQSKLRELGLDPEKLTGGPETEAAIREALAAKRPVGTAQQLRAAMTAKPGKLTDPQALALRDRLRARLEAARPEPMAVDQSGSGKRAAQRVFRSVEGALEQMPGVGNELAGRVRAVEHQAETLAGRDAVAVKRAVDPLGTSDAARAKAFDDGQGSQALESGQIEALPEGLRAAARAIKATFRGIGERAVEAKLLKPGDLAENYWPRVPIGESVAGWANKVRAKVEASNGKLSLEDAAAQLRPDLIVTTTKGRRAGAEIERGKGKAALQEGQYRRDLGVAYEHINEMNRRIAEAEHFGKDGEHVQRLINRIDPEGRGGKLGDRAYAQGMINKLRGVDQRGAMSDVSSMVRAAQSGVSLVYSPIQQVGSQAQTVAIAGVKPTAKALREVFWNPKVMPEGRGPRKAANRVLESYKKAKLDAGESGALATNIGGDLADLYGTLAGNAPGGGPAGTVGRLASRTPWLKLAQAVDQAQRIIAAKTAEHFVPRLVEQARGGSAKASRDLGWLHVDWQDWKGTPEQIASAAKSFADRTQYRVGMTHLPGWTSTPVGKMAFQFQSFGYQHAQFMGHLFQEAARGRVGPLARWAAVAYVVGLGGNKARAALKGYATDDADPDKMAANLVDAFANPTRKNYDAASPYAAVAALASSGGLGILTTAAQKVDDLSQGKVLDVALGPTGSDVVSSLRGLGGVVGGAKDIVKLGAARASGDREGAAVAERSAEKNFGRAGKGALRAVAGMLPNLPILSPTEVVKELTSDTKPERPGWFGRGRDLAEERGLLPVANAADSGSAGRVLAARLKRVSEKASEIGAENEAQKTERLQVPLDKRVAGADKRLLRETYEAALIEAIRSKDKRRIRDVVQRAAKDKIRISYQQINKLMGRLTPQEQETQ